MPVCSMNESPSGSLQALTSLAPTIARNISAFAPFRDRHPPPLAGAYLAPLRAIVVMAEITVASRMRSVNRVAAVR